MRSPFETDVDIGIDVDTLEGQGRNGGPSIEHSFQHFALIIGIKQRHRVYKTPRQFRLVPAAGGSKTDNVCRLVRQFIEGQPEGPIPLRQSKVKYEVDLLT